MRRRSRILIVLLCAFGLRMWQLDTLIFTHDFGVPHGLGIRILELITAGQWRNLPLQSFASGVAIANPPAISYFWALIALFDRNPYSAAVVSVLLNVAGVAALYAVGNSLFRQGVGLIAALFMAGSGWSAFFARGTWMQGQLEAFACIVAWLLWTGIQHNRSRRVFAAFCAAALFAQTYLTAFGLTAQAVLATLVSWRHLDRAAHRAFVRGVIVCAAGFVAYGLIAATHSAPADNAIANVTTRAIEAAYLIPNPFGLNLDLAGLWRSMSLISNADFSPDIDPGLALPSLIIEVACTAGLLLGAAVCLRKWRASGIHRSVLLWFCAPALGALIISIVYPQLGIGGRQYMLLGTPAGYLLAALGTQAAVSAGAVRARGDHMKWPGGSRAAAILLVALAAARMTMSAAQMQAHAAGELATAPNAARFEVLSLRHQLGFARAWQTLCNEVANPQMQSWQVSLLGASEKVHQGMAQIAGQSIVWQRSPAGGNCLTLTAREPVPHHADIVLTQNIAGEAVATYRTKPIASDAVISGELELAPAAPGILNLGWRLVGTHLPAQVRAGENVVVTQVWHIESLPQEPHGDWCYSLFATWQDATGRTTAVVSSVEAGPLPCGRLWRVGDYIVSQQAIPIPAESAAGPGRLDVTVYDARQGKNAAYIAPDGSVQVATPLSLDVVR
jgi:4-amino-4-deoxy-L-arabinose transferase-like glycosyltransferase